MLTSDQPGLPTLFSLTGSYPCLFLKAIQFPITTLSEFSFLFRNLFSCSPVWSLFLLTLFSFFLIIFQFHYIARAGSECSKQAWVALNSHRYTCLCLLNAGNKSVRHCTWPSYLCKSSPKRAFSDVSLTFLCSWAYPASLNPSHHALGCTYDTCVPV